MNAQASAPSNAGQLKCERGPAERTYVGVQWLVLACDDGKSVVFVTAPGSPEGMSFFFIVFPKGQTYGVHGEGQGDETLTKPVYDAIIAMRPDEVAALHAEAAAKGDFKPR